MSSSGPMHGGPAERLEDASPDGVHTAGLAPPLPSAVGGGSERDLERAVARGVAWNGIGKWVPQLISWPATILIARLLSPSDYGLVAIVGVYTRFVALLTDGGIASAVVVDQTVTEERAGQLHTLALCLGLGGFALSCLLAWPIALFYKRPGLEFALVVASLIFVVNSLAIVPGALLRKQFRFKELAVGDVTRMVTDLSVEIPMAFLGFGYWTLIAGNLAGTIGWLAIVWYRANPGFRRPRLDALRSVLTLSRHFAVRTIGDFVAASSDVVVAGKLVTQAAVGQYNFALMLAQAPLGKITALVSAVSPTLFASVSTDIPRMRRYALLLSEGLAFVIVPALVGLALVATDLVHVMLGAQWALAARPLQLLALYAAFYSVTVVFPNVLQTTGQAHLPARNGVLAMCVLPVLFYLFGKQWGITGIAAAWLVGFPLTFSPLLVAAFRTLELSAATFIRTIAPALSGSAVMAVAVTVLQRSSGGWASPVRLAASCALGAVVYTAYAGIFYRRRIQTVVGLLRDARRGAA